MPLEYRPRQPRLMFTRSSVALFAIIVAILVIVGAFIAQRRPSPTLATQTTVFRFVDARTNAVIPITVTGPTYPATDPSRRKITVLPPNGVQIQWVGPNVPGNIYVTSLGYQGIGISSGIRSSGTMNIRLWPTTHAAPPATIPLGTIQATRSSSPDSRDSKGN